MGGASLGFVDVGRTFQTREGRALVALEAVDFTVGQGEFVSVVGPSGCGKTTLLRMVAGLLGPSSGSVLVNGKRVTGPMPDIGIVFQQALLLPWLSVLGNVLLPIDVQGRPRRDYVSRAHELINVVGLGGFEKRLPAELSGGMQQRVALARALVHDPTILLMDEPFAALDAITREAMSLELQRIWAAERKTVLFITHGIAEAVFLSDRVVVMTPRPGRIAAIIAVPTARPRDLRTLGSPEFARLTAQVRESFGPHALPEH